MALIWILGVSVVLQFSAAFLAFRLIQHSGRTSAWFLIGMAALFMSIRRSISFAGAVSGAVQADLMAELVALGISALLVVGLLLVRRDLQNSLKDAAEKDRVVASLIDIYYTTDTLGRVERISDAVEQVLGYKPEEVIGHSIADFYVLPEQRDELLSRLVSEGGEVKNFVAALRSKDGESVVLETNTRLRRNEQGVTVGVEGVARDVTERYLRDQQINQLGRIVDGASNEIYVFEAKTLKFLIVNKGARENLGYSMDEMRQLKPVDLKPDYSEAQFRTLIEPLLNGTRAALSFETMHQRKDGSCYPVEVLLQYASSEVHPVLIANIQDLTERKRVEAELIQSQRLQSVGQLTGGVAHDFNNMLQGLQLNLEAIDPADAKQKENKAAALRAVARAAQLTQRLLAFARRQQLKPSVISVNDTICSFQQLLERSLGETSDLAFELAPGLPPIEIDEAQLENALLNLVINARDATTQGDEVVISTRVVDIKQRTQGLDLDAGRYVIIEVADSGCGMREEVLENALEPFYSTKQAGQGTGLGLSTVYGFVKQSGGDIAIESSPNNGTTVTLYFAASDKRFAGTVAPLAVGAHRGRESILLIEDEELVRAVASATLRSLGYEVLEAANGSDALNLAHEARQIDLVLSDVKLKGDMSGPVAVTNILQELGPTLRFGFMSGYLEVELTEGEEILQSARLLQKPFTRDELGRFVREIMDSNDQGQL